MSDLLITIITLGFFATLIALVALSLGHPAVAAKVPDMLARLLGIAPKEPLPKSKKGK